MQAVLWLRKGGLQGGNEGGCSQRIRGPLSLAWRPFQRGGQGRAAWLYSQPGDARSSSAGTGPEPEQGKPAHRWRKIQAGQTENTVRAGRQAVGRNRQILFLFLPKGTCTMKKMDRQSCCIFLRRYNKKRKLHNTWKTNRSYNRQWVCVIRVWA